MASTSTYFSCPPRWDVFLSFYGEDTRKNIIDSLYMALNEAKIPTFRDDHALKRGQEISSGLCNAIKDSNMFVVVISENYARSSWCLNELVEILKYKRTKKQVVPVLYYVDPSDVVMVKELSEKESLKLFSYHAFGKSTPPQNFREVSVRFANRARGLPSAIRNLSFSYLLEKAKLGENVGESSEESITEILELSYNELDDEIVKAIFLDVVFFFVGKDRYEAVQIFESCGFFPYVGIRILEEKCLLTIDEDNKFQMHNLIQGMGNGVIRKQSEQGDCRYLCLDQGNACETLLNLEGRNKIEGLILDLTMTEEQAPKYWK